MNEYMEENTGEEEDDVERNKEEDSVSYGVMGYCQRPMFFKELHTKKFLAVFGLLDTTQHRVITNRSYVKIHLSVINWQLSN